MKQPADLCDRDADWLAGEDLVEGVGQVVLRRRGGAVAVAELVVDAAAVENCARAIKDERLGRALGTEAVGDDIAGVLENGERQFVFAGMLGDVAGVS